MQRRRQLATGKGCPVPAGPGPAVLDGAAVKRSGGAGAAR
jgi:hypothetical protein